MRVVADAFYSKAPFLNGLLARGIDVISRLRKDAVGWDDPEPPPPGKRGRKPRYGRKWTLASLLTAETPTRERLSLYGKLTEVVFVVRDVWLRDVAQKVRVVVLEGAKEPFILVSTDLTLSALQIIEIYGARFSIELTIRDLKQHFGLGDYQCTTTLAILRFVHLACVAFCLWRLAPPGAPGGRLAPGDLGAGVPARSSPELPAGPPGLAGLGYPAGHFGQCQSWGGLGKNRAGS